MPDRQAIDRRLRAVERALTDGEADLGAVRDAAETAERVAALESELEATRERVAELEAATQALRGYVGNVRSVNEGVAERADAALAAVERLEDERDPDTSERLVTGRSGSDTTADPAPSADPIDEVDDALRSDRSAEGDDPPTAAGSNGLLARIRDRL